MFDIIIVVIKLSPMKAGIFLCFDSWSVLVQCLVLDRHSTNICWVNEYYYNQKNVFYNADIIYFGQQRTADSYD